MEKSIEISPGLLLYTLDVSNALGISSIEYSLEVRKAKLVVFSIDFHGSQNVHVENGLGELHAKSLVGAWERKVVGVVRVLDQSKPWGLETKYTWVEENPGTVQPGQSKREVLSEGIVLVTSRITPPDTFLFQILVEKAVPVTLTLDCSKSVNLQMVVMEGEGDGGCDRDVSKLKGNVTSVVVGAYSKCRVCALVVKNPNKGYQLKTKWTWIEGVNGVTMVSSNDNDDVESEYPAPRARPTFFQPETPPSQIPAPPMAGRIQNRVTLLPQNVSPPMALVEESSDIRTISAGKTNPRLKREEISPMVYLDTEIFEDANLGADVLYKIEVAKNTRVTFEGDFKGSTNLQLYPGGGLVCEAIVEPMSRMQVARLRVVNPKNGWKLACRYKWQEEDVVPGGGGSKKSSSSAASKRDQSLGSLKASSSAYEEEDSSPPSSKVTRDVKGLLSSLSLDAYLPYFQQEELSLELLRVMVKDESEFRRSLQDLGVNKMGHRERILVAVKELPPV